MLQILPTKLHLKNMGSGDWFKTIVGRRQTKQDRLKQAKGNSSDRSSTSKRRNHSKSKVSKAFCNGSSKGGNPEDSGLTVEDVAARRIQTAFRGFKSRRALRRLKGLRRLQDLRRCHSVKKQASTALSHLQSWSRIQAEIRARRACMVTEGRIKQKKEENQVKLEAKLHDIEADWCGGSETMGEIHSRIQQREEAAVKRERAMAYAFSHQWRANSGRGQLSYELGKGNWGWSWMERWIAARPWEARMAIEPTSPRRVRTKATDKADKKTNTNASRVSTPVRNADAATNGKGPPNRPSPKPTEEKPITKESCPRPPKTKMKKEQHHHPPQQTSGITV